jgi:hypothetical protein
MCLVRLASDHFCPLLTVACYLYNNNVPTVVVIFRGTVYVVIFVELSGTYSNMCSYFLEFLFNENKTCDLA